MNPTRLTVVMVALAALGIGVLGGAGPEPDRIMESLPPKVQARIEVRQRMYQNLPASVGGQPTRLVITTLKRWPRGHVVTVAIRGGDAALHAKIAQAAGEWLKGGAALKLDFGFNAGTGLARSWNPTDKQFVADVRIGFDQPGYWSMVGTDSSDPGVARPGEASMNFQEFETNPPQNASTVIEHEFGHALGFQHEHQSAVGDCEEVFRWKDDAGYVLTLDQYEQAINDSKGHRPGIYTVLGYAPNYWPKSQVDFNLRRLPISSAYDFGVFDPKSIMKYWFPAWMFVNTDNLCFTPTENEDLSAIDRSRVVEAYPPNANANLDATRTSFIQALQGLDQTKSPDLKQAIEHQIKLLEKR